MEFFAFISELFVDIYLFFLDFKFWKKKRAQRKYEKEKGLPKKLMIYPSDKIYLRVVLLLVLLMIPTYFLVFKNKNQSTTKKQITEIHNLLSAEKKQFNIFPKALQDIIRNNPLHKDLTIDAWNNEFSYSVTEDGLNYTLVSKGKDGVLNTEDDVK